ncbi:MAG: hypothetical protein IT364_16610 [Candidatus Hydrogenedentes bacterium]|nr:hypothetical protein [Candidatus Hydrogenedentota bacterium]
MSKKWTPTQRQKFRKTMAAKRANKRTTAVIPLDAIPERRAQPAPRPLVPSDKHARLALAMALVSTVRELIK